jgi:Flp pilus assembly protein TadD
MKPLKPPDRFHVEAAQGWLELGNPVEAEHELERISVVHRSHPEVLRIRWRIRAQAQDWKASLRIARRLKAIDPIHSFAWLHEAQSLEQLGRTSEARQVILSAIERCGSSPALSLYMAHLSAVQQQGESEARIWFSKAIDMARDSETLDGLRLRALKDPSLEAIWTQLQERSKP